VGDDNSGDSEDRSSAARQFAIDAARLALQTRCHSIVILDVRGLSPVTDFLVIATGTSTRQMRSVAQEVEEYGQTHNYASISSSNAEGENWILIDCVDVVVHLFSTDARHYYDLENLWGDGQRVEFEPADAARR
jgi:ribosome-associated protein